MSKIHAYFRVLNLRLAMMVQDICRRWRFWRICHAVGIKPYPWQRDFELGLIGCDAFPKGRATGKTMAVMLRILMLPPNASQVAVRTILARDPDWDPRDPRRCRWYAYEYMRLRVMCAEQGIETVNALEQCRAWGRK